MAFTHQEGKGSIFHERDKDNPRAPDLKGKATLNGETIYISGWNSDRFDGISLSLETETQRAERIGPPRDHEQREEREPPPPRAGGDDIPF